MQPTLLSMCISATILVNNLQLKSDIRVPLEVRSMAVCLMIGETETMTQSSEIMSDRVEDPPVMTPVSWLELPRCEVESYWTDEAMRLELLALL